MGNIHKRPSEDPAWIPGCRFGVNCNHPPVTSLLIPIAFWFLTTWKILENGFEKPHVVNVSAKITMPGERGDQGWCQVNYCTKIEIWTSPMWIEIFVLPATQFDSWNPRYTVYIYIYYRIYCKIFQDKHKHSGTGVRIFVTNTNPKRYQTLVDSAPKTCHPASSHKMTICFYAVRKHPPRPQNASASTLLLASQTSFRTMEPTLGSLLQPCIHHLLRVNAPHQATNILPKCRRFVGL